MSNAKRPSTTRTRTPKDEAAREAALDENFSVKIDDTVYTLVPADITGLIEAKVRRETGMSVTEIIAKMSESPGMDLIGAFMFAAEVAAGRSADYEAILGSVSWGSDFDVVDGQGNPLPQP